ncbi:hypothetical protein SCLCIDRAFT_31931 [Scleroderma citrinum Foug A]|uniref:Uncharacterized protein n=1 Tax=Scleroderma citrinum Foug A TaxID=1036808 RepID=A0A0C2ZL36_9AGAM|nr:hypothetical protein SCLCIDRAFT_31931 [Scleroderma citrinum Foug A]
MDSLSAYATPVPDTNTTLMDTNDTAPTLTVPLADNMPGLLCLLPSSGSSEPTSGGQGTMVVYNRSLICSAPKDTASHLPKVVLREVDHSSTLHAQVYDIRNRLYHKDANFTILEGRFHQKDTNLCTLEAHMKNKDVIIMEQAQLLLQLRNDLEEVKLQTATQSSALAQIGSKDAIIMQQSETLEKLQRAVLEAKMEIQRLEVDRELEILALNHNYEMALRKVQELQSHPLMPSPPVSKHMARPRSTLRSRQLVCHYLDEQDLSEMTAPAQSGQSAPASTAQVLPSQSGSEQSTSASTSAQVPSAAAPLTISDDDLKRIVEELHQHVNAGSQSTPKRGRRKVQGLHQEVETDVQQKQNLPHVRDLFKTAFMVNQDEDFLQCNGMSTQEAKVFTEETGPGPNPSRL